MSAPNNEEVSCRRSLGRRSLAALAYRPDRWTPGPEVTLSITGADAARWTATAEHRDVTTTCSIAGVGDGPSEPVCVPGTLKRSARRP